MPRFLEYFRDNIYENYEDDTNAQLIKEIDEISIFEHAESVFKAKYKEAIEVLNDNLINITNYAKNERK